MNTENFFTKEFKSFDTDTKEEITTSRLEWENMTCSIDMTQVSDEEMEKVSSLLYMQEDDKMLDVAEAFLMTDTKAKYLEDYNDKEFKSYQKRKNILMTKV